MELLPSGIPLTFEVTYDRADLDVGMTVYEVVNGVPSLLLSPFAMTWVYGYTYIGVFTGEIGKSYLIVKSVYTNDTFEERDTEYASGSETCVCIYVNYLSSNPSECPVVGFMECCNGPSTSEGLDSFSIFRGDKKTMTMKIMQVNCKGDPVDLTYCTEIDVALPNADGSTTHLLLSESKVEIKDPALLGKFSVPITALKSALLNPGEFQNLDVTFTIASAEFTVRFFGALSVFDR